MESCVKVAWAYLAGIIDGEGCIGVHRTYGNYCQLRVTICNTDPTLIAWIETNFGGYSRLEQQQKPNWKPSIRFQWTGHKAAAVLENSLPYLVAKKHRAKLGIEFMRSATKDRQEAIKVELHKLNLRGLKENDN